VGFFSSCNPKVKLKEFTSYELRCISHEEPEPSGEGLRFQPFYEDVLAVLLDPVALLVLLVFLLHSAPGDAVGAILLSVLFLRGVEGLLVDLLCFLGEIVLHIIRKLRDLLQRLLPRRRRWAGVLQVHR
jgi:hypothetical protein